MTPKYGHGGSGSGGGCQKPNAGLASNVANNIANNTYFAFIFLSPFSFYFPQNN
jgi:hypothetical protein